MLGHSWTSDQHDAFLDATQDRRPLFLEWFFGRTREMWESGCWEWQGPVNTDTGYGLVYLPAHLRWLSDKGRHYCTAHRVAWRLANPERVIPDDLWILHHCDNRSCVRPSHLYLGTPTQNARDREVRTYGRVPA